METRRKKVGISFDLILQAKFASNDRSSSVHGRTAKAEQKYAAESNYLLEITKTNWMYEEYLSN